MQYEVLQGKAKQTMSDRERLFGVVLMGGDCLYTYAHDVLEAYDNIFGNTSYASSVRCIMLIDSNLTV